MLDEAAPPLHNGRYQLQRVLGAGGMATVYLARDGLLQVDRAIKVLAPHLARRRAIRERFLLEARSMARIAAPSVVRVFDFGQDGDRVFLVMEVVAGGSLMDRIEHRGPLPPEEAARLVAGALDGLSAAHAAGYVHRDVKPHNILLTAEDLPKLTDFGIAQAQTREHSLTRTGTVMGTWAYMAPEQRTDAKRADLRSDLYSMGATLFACLTGAEPFDLYVEQVAAELPRRMPPALAEVVRRATRYSPDDRYASADEMACALRALAGEALGPGAPLETEPAREAPSHTLVPAQGGDSSSTFDPSALDPASVDEPGPLGLAATGLTPSGPSREDSGPLSEAPTAPTPTHTRVTGEVSARPPPRRWLGPVAGGVLLVAGAALFVPSAFQSDPPSAGPRPPSPAAAAPSPAGRPQADSSPAPPARDAPPASDPAPTAPAPAPAAEAPPEARRPDPSPAAPADPTPRAEPPAPPPEPPAVEASTPEPAAPAAPPGRVFLNSQPYSVVSIDGAEVGRTPIRGRELSPGVHAVSFRTSSGKVVQHEVRVESDQNVRLCWDLDLEDFCR